MKRFLSVLMLVFAVALFANCGEEEAQPVDSTPTVVTPTVDPAQAKKDAAMKSMQDAETSMNKYKAMYDKYKGVKPDKAKRYYNLYTKYKGKYDDAKATYEKLK